MPGVVNPHSDPGEGAPLRRPSGGVKNPAYHLLLEEAGLTVEIEQSEFLLSINFWARDRNGRVARLDRAAIEVFLAELVARPLITIQQRHAIFNFEEGIGSTNDLNRATLDRGER